MNWLLFVALLAQVRVKEPKPGDWAFGWGTVAMIAAVSSVIVLVIWLIMFWLRMREQRTVHSPWRLFHDLCGAHGFTHGEKSLVKQLARAQNLQQPGGVFVEPGWWESERLPPGLSSHFAELEKLRKRIFAPR